jgi:hypothetical protein
MVFGKAETPHLLLFVSQTANHLDHLFAASPFGPTRKAMLLLHEYWRHAHLLLFLNIPAGGSCHCTTLRTVRPICGAFT